MIQHCLQPFLVDHWDWDQDLNKSESQWRDWEQDWKGLSLNNKTKFETEKVWFPMTRLRLKMSESQLWDWDQDWKGLSLNDKTKSENV